MNIRLKTKILESPLNQAQLAKQVGTTQSWLSNIIQGHQDASGELMQAIADALNCKVSDIF
jgi:transcriptional regulator with XRE-family HTH domain